MANGIIDRPYSLNTAKSVDLDLYSQAGWLQAHSVAFLTAKPTITGGAIRGERNLTAAEIAAFNSEIYFTIANHEVRLYTTNQTLANLSGKHVFLSW